MNEPLLLFQQNSLLWAISALSLTFLFISLQTTQTSSQLSDLYVVFTDLFGSGCFSSDLQIKDSLVFGTELV